MAIFKCKMCGGDLQISDADKVIECEYCGTNQTVPSADNEKKLNLFNRANRLRINGEFDKATAIYESIVAEFPEEAEAYWGLVICNYGIEYVDDPATAKKIPTCHRASFESIQKDENYELALEYADVVAQKIYRDEAREIDRIREEILAVSKNEQPYDIFICYKETDESGERTIDSVLAQDVYDALTAKGYRVFFARISLEDKLGRQYEPYIFAALNSAKVMLSFGTKYEYFHAVWVKNEWSRFLKLMAKDKSKALIPCYKDMDAYDLPDEFKALQAQDMGKVGAIQDLLRGIEKIIPRETAKAETVIVQQSTNNPAIDSLLKRAFMFLEDGEWERADDFCEQVLNIDPECARAYLGKLMADLKVGKQEDLKDQTEPFDSNNNYQKAIRFDDDLKNTLAGYIENINIRNENARIENIYTRAKNIMLTAKAEINYQKAAQLFESIIGYKDAQECYEKAETARKDAIYEDGISWMTDSITSCKRAISLLRSIPGWKDADKKIIECEEKIKKIEVEEEIEQKKELQSAKKHKIIASIITSVICAIVLVYAIWGKDISQYFTSLNTYKNAIALMEKGDLNQAYYIFKKLDGFKDSNEKAGDIRLSEFFEKSKDIKIGDTIEFGSYEQDNIESTGKEKIKWKVLDIKDGKALVISKNILFFKEYNKTDSDVTWETCSIRKWLNKDFLNYTFSDSEKALISTETVTTEKNAFNISGGNDTKDRIFLLSLSEVERYLKNYYCTPTKYASSAVSFESTEWWLRTPGNTQNRAVYTYGTTIAKGGSIVSFSSIGVRPAMWIDLSK